VVGILSESVNTKYVFSEFGKKYFSHEFIKDGTNTSYLPVAMVVIAIFILLDGQIEEDVPRLN
jgi:hypothetical protein